MSNSPNSPRWMSAVLVAAAAYNFVWGLFVILFPKLPFALADMPAPNYPAVVQCLGMVIGVYGVGYAIAARDPARHWPLVLVGLLGKLFGPVGFVWAAAHGEFPWIGGLVILCNEVAWWLPFTAILLHAAKVHDEQRGDLGSFREELERAKTSTGESLWDLSHRQPLLVTFVRHSGCTFCREAVFDVGQQAEAMEAAGVKPVIVHMGPVEDGEKLLRWSGRDDVETVSDPDRRLFRAFDLRLGTLWQLAGPQVAWRALFGNTLFRFGFGKMVGNGMQLGGAFLLDRGRIVQSHRCRTAADRIDFAGMACAVEK